MQLPDRDSSTGFGDIGVALEQIISTQCLPPRGARRIDRATELPVRLQHLLCTVGPEPAWREDPRIAAAFDSSDR